MLILNATQYVWETSCMKFHIIALTVKKISFVKYYSVLMKKDMNNYTITVQVKMNEQVLFINGICLKQTWNFIQLYPDRKYVLCEPTYMKMQTILLVM